MAHFRDRGGSFKKKMKVIGGLRKILQAFENSSIFEKVLQLFWSDPSNSEFKIVFILQNQFLSRET